MPERRFRIFDSIERVLVPCGLTLQDAIERLEIDRRGIVLVVDDDLRLLGVVTDGDVRRCILNRMPFTTPVSELIVNHPPPVTLPATTPAAAIVEIMHRTKIRHIPLLDADGRITDMATLETLLDDIEHGMVAMVMAGGFGKRLMPLTANTPKPMIVVGDKPILEHIVNLLRADGIAEVKITTHYLPEQIVSHFGDGSRFGINIDYVHEETPRGTAGALSLVGPVDRRILLVNGDILTRVSFRGMAAFHLMHNADLTVATRSYDVPVPFGVLELDGVDILNVVEKPTYHLPVAAGIYLMEPAVAKLVPPDREFQMPDLIAKARANGLRVVSFPIAEYWRDIGQMHELEQAINDVREWV